MVIKIPRQTKVNHQPLGHPPPLPPLKSIQDGQGLSVHVRMVTKPTFLKTCRTGPSRTQKIPSTLQNVDHHTQQYVHSRYTPYYQLVCPSPKHDVASPSKLSSCRPLPLAIPPPWALGHRVRRSNSSFYEQQAPTLPRPTRPAIETPNTLPTLSQHGRVLLAPCALLPLTWLNSLDRKGSTAYEADEPHPIGAVFSHSGCLPGER